MPESAVEGRVLTNTGQRVELDVRGYGGAAIQITGTFVGTLAFEVTVDGETWVAIYATKSNSTTPATSTTSTGAFALSVAGYLKLGVRFSAYTSGEAKVFLRADPASGGGAGGGGGGGGGAVTVADGADVAEGSIADAEWSGSGDGTVIAILKKLANSGTGGGPATIADGADVAEGATTDAKVTGDSAGTVSAKLRGLSYLWAMVIDTGAQVVKISAAALPLPSGAATAAKQPALGTAGSPSADVLTVQGNASGTPIPVSGTVATTVSNPGTGTTSRTAVNSSNVTVLASNASRKGATLVNESEIIARVKFGATATATDYSVLLLPGGTIGKDLLQGYTGQIDAIWDSAGSGAMQVTELT